MDDVRAEEAVALLAIAACEEFDLTFTDAVAVRLGGRVAGVAGWVGVERHLDALVARGLVGLVGEDAAGATAAAGRLLAARGWLRDLPGGGQEVTEQGRYWLRRAVRDEDARTWRTRLRGWKAAAVAGQVFAAKRRA
jgi:hypothetical protein